MRLRSLAPWILIPPLLGAALAAWFVSRSVSAERDEVAGIGAAAMAGSSTSTASAWIASEVVNLAALDAFIDDDPRLRDYQTSVAATRDAMSREQMLSSLDVGDRQGTKLADDIRGLGMVPASVEQILRPLDPSIRKRLGEGATHLVDPTPYGDAVEWTFEQYRTADGRATDAVTKLQQLDDRPPYWRDRTFLGFTFGLVLLAVTGAVLAIWRVSVGGGRLVQDLAEEQARAAQLDERSERLRSLVRRARQLSADSDLQSLARTLVRETREVLRSEVVALARRDGQDVSPYFSAGQLRVTAVTGGNGVVGHCVDTGSVVRTVVAADPFFPGVVGPIAVLAAPLVADGHVIGALVAGSRIDVPFDENDEMALELLAFLGAGDVMAAQRFDSTLAMAQRDALTGLLNRRRLDGDLAARLHSSGAVAFLMIDVDHFKAFNDTFGHQRGDELLQTVARAISSAVREGDVVYRYGGEEFCVLLPDADAALAGVVAERVRATVRSATAHGVRPVTVSVGVAADERGGVATALVERADAALYAAKQTGRDRVVMNTTA